MVAGSVLHAPVKADGHCSAARALKRCIDNLLWHLLSHQSAKSMHTTPCGGTALQLPPIPGITLSNTDRQTRFFNMTGTTTGLCHGRTTYELDVVTYRTQR